MIDLLFIDDWHEYWELGPLIISPAVIKEYGIEGWMIDGKMVPLHGYQSSFDRGAKVHFNMQTPKVRVGEILIMHDLHLDFPGVKRVWQENVESSNKQTVIYAENNISAAQKIQLTSIGSLDHRNKNITASGTQVIQNFI